jgi:hypothetical protein
MMRTSAFTAWIACLCVSVAAAQVARKEPVQYAGTERTSRVEVRPPGIRLGLRKAREFTLAPLSASESAKLAGPATRAITGIHREFPASALQGAWEVTSEGQRVWRLTLRSPEAAGIRVQFMNFAVGDGRVWLYSGDRVAGPYTGRGIYEDGNFWTATMSSESVTVEYEPAKSAATEDTLPFEIRSISHQVKPATRGAFAATPEAASKDTADICHLDPSCYAEWKPAMSMVAQIGYEEDGLAYLCSGSLLATRDNSFKPYFLTAGHCIHSEAAARTLEVYWNYQTSACGATPPASRDTSIKSTLGAHLIDWATIDQGDYSLMLLNDAPPAGATFSGWDANDPPLTTRLTGIHHPAGSWKRISFGQRSADQSVYVGEDPAPGNKFLEVLWDKGRTEPGSSGSPLFSSPGVVVGMLSYGPYSPSATACEIDPSIDGYGRFSNAYANLKAYLENLPAALVTADKPLLVFTVANRTAPPGQAVHLVTQSTGSIGYKLRTDAPWIRVSGGSGSASANSPAEITISIDPAQFDRAGQYSGTVTILSGSAPPQFINVAVAATMVQSNVTASISPTTVTTSTGEWDFHIRLEETAGAATRLTGIKFNGTDYSMNIKDWFGSDTIPAKGVLEAPLTGAGIFPAGLQFFEFRGVDQVSGQVWLRTATVEFR